MSNSNSVHPSTEVNADLLKQDRRAAGYTQSSLSAACDSVSLATIRRAEQGHRVIETSLARIAEVLGHSVDRYIAKPALQSLSQGLNVSGEWTNFYVIADLRKSPHILEQDIVFRQTAQQIEGQIVSKTSLAPRIIQNGTAHQNIVTGTTRFESNYNSPRLGTFFVLASRGDTWLEGYSTWYSPSTRLVENSRVIAVKKNHPLYSQYITEARQAMQAELETHRIRKLTEAGHPLVDAVTMLDSLDGPSTNANDGPNYRIMGQEFLTDNSISNTDFTSQILQIESVNIGYDSVTVGGTAEHWGPILKEQPNCWRLLTKNGNIKGYWHYCALLPEYMREIQNGQLHDSEIRLDKLDYFTLPGTYSIYITSVVLAPESRHGKPFKMLFDSMFQSFEDLAESGIYIDQMVLTAWTVEAENLARRLGFEKIATSRQADKDLPIYRSQLTKILANQSLDDFSNLRQIYKDR